MTVDLTKGRPAKVILLFSLPIILGNVFQQLYSMVDAAIVGRCVDFRALAGVGATNGLSFVVLNFALGVTSGLGIKVAHYFGAGDYRRMRASIGTGLIICAALSVLLTLLSLGLCTPLLRLMNTPSEIFGFSRSYISIVFAGLAATIAYNMMACVLRAVGNSSAALQFLILSTVVNVALDLLFVALFGWGVQGAAVATVLSQLIAAVLSFVYAFRRYPFLRLSAESFRTSRDFIREHLRIGLPMALQFSITGIGLILLQAALNAFPPTSIAGFTAANKVQNVGSLVAVAFGVAIANYVAQNWGAGDVDRIRRGVKCTLAMSLAVCICASVLMVVLADPLTSLFVEKGTVEPDIWLASRKYLQASAVFFPFLYVLLILRNALQGIGKTFWPLMAGLLELLIRSVFSFVLPPRMGYDGIVLVDPLAWVGACLLLAVAYLLQMPRKLRDIS